MPFQIRGMIGMRLLKVTIGRLAFNLHGVEEGVGLSRIIPAYADYPASNLRPLLYGRILTTAYRAEFSFRMRGKA